MILPEFRGDLGKLCLPFSPRVAFNSVGCETDHRINLHNKILEFKHKAVVCKMNGWRQCFFSHFVQSHSVS